MCPTDLEIESKNPDTSFVSGIAEAIFPRIRGKILAFFMLNPERRFYFREAVRIIGDSPASIQRELKSLTAAGILKMEPIGIQKFYSANRSSPVHEELRSIMKKTFGIPEALRKVLRAYTDKIQIAWINVRDDYDRTVEGNAIDLTIVGTLWVGDLAGILEPVEEILGRPITPSLYTKEDFAKKCNLDSGFREIIVETKKLFLIGSKDELDRRI